MSNQRDRAPKNSNDPASETPTAGMPRWVKAFLITAVALVVLLVAVMLISGGDHGPRRHLSSTTTIGTALQQIHVPALSGAVG